MAFTRKEFHKDENCLNCGVPLIGEYCANCGQKAHLHKDSMLHMIIHFAGDYFHYDNKFWRTIKTIFTKPGQVTLDYIQGKRVKYLNPVQLYIFVSTVFFIIFFSLDEGSYEYQPPTPGVNRDTMGSTNESFNIFIDNDVHLEWRGKKRTVEEYDSAQSLLPASERDGVLIAWVIHRIYHAESVLNGPCMNGERLYNEKVSHSLPKSLFILLPFFALLVHLLFAKKKYYIDQIVFSIHFHVVFFLVLTILFLLQSPVERVDKSGIAGSIVDTAGLAVLPVYFFLSLKRVYNRGWRFTLLSGTLLLFLYLIAAALTMVVIFVLSLLLL